jgi:putative ABC transport system substrate-binding protein
VRRREFITLLGGAAAWPLGARAQQPAKSVIGFLRQGPPEPSALTNAFREGLSETGINEGHEVTIENRWAEGHYDRLPALAADLVNHGVAVIAAAFLPAALAAKAATHTIPIVFLSGSDPIGAGLVSSINRPTGNVTGIAPMFTLLGGKNLELLHELVPKATVIGALAKPSNPNAQPQLRDLQAAARALSRELVIFGADNEQEIDSSFARNKMPEISPSVIPAGTYRSLARNYHTIGVYNFAIAHKDLPDEFIYKLVKTVFDDHEELMKSQPWARETIPANIDRNTMLPLHPGALRYYREVGITVPRGAVMDN